MQRAEVCSGSIKTTAVVYLMKPETAAIASNPSKKSRSRDKLVSYALVT